MQQGMITKPSEVGDRKKKIGKSGNSEAQDEVILVGWDASCERKWYENNFIKLSLSEEKGLAYGDETVH